MEGMYFSQPGERQVSPHERVVQRKRAELFEILMDGIDQGRLPDMTRDEAIQQVSQVANDAETMEELIKTYGGEDTKLHGR